MKYLGTSYSEIMGLDNILKSDIVASLETLEGVLITPTLSSTPFQFAFRKRLEVKIEEDTNGSLHNLSRILHNCPTVEILKMDLFPFDVIDKESWTNVINECYNVTSFKILRSTRGRIHVSLLEDYFAKLIESRMKKIETLDLGFTLSPKGLLALEKLENLKSFRHFVNVRETMYEYIEDAKALLSFLRCHFEKYMTKYEMCLRYNYVQKELIFPLSFLSSIQKMQSELSVDFKTCYKLGYFTGEKPPPLRISKD